MAQPRPIWKNLMIFLAVFSALAAGADTRVWTSASGDEIEAEFVRLDWDTVQLKTKEGKSIRIRLNLLSSEDQVLAHKLAKEGGAEASAGAARDKPQFLPVFTEGPHKNKHAVYETETFTAWVNRIGDIVVRPIKDGKPVGKAFSLFRPRLPYTQKNSWGARQVVKYTKAPAPTKTPSVLEIEGEAEEGIRFSYTYTFEGNTICAKGSIRNPGSLKPKSFLQFSTGFPRTHNIAPEVPQSERVKILDGLTLAYETHDGKEQTRLFHKGGARGVHGVKQFEVRGVWPGRIVRMTADKSGKVHSILWNYGGNPLWEGFVHFYRIWDGAGSQSVCITIE
jgi:hypothetical protein